MITLKKIADLANVSVSTVSRALNNAYDVAPDTRDEILKIAKENGYFSEKKRIKNENRKKSRFQIAIICPEINSDFYSIFASKLVNEFQKNNCNCIIYNSFFDKTTITKLLEECIDNAQIDAVISLSHTIEFPHHPHTPVIMAGTIEKTSSIRFSTIDAFEQITDAIISEGIKKVAFISEPLTTGKCREFSIFAAEHGIEVEPFIAGSRFDSAGKEAAKHFIKRNDIPNLLVCAYDEIAYGVIDTLLKSEIKVPEEVGVIGWNDIPNSKYCFGGLTTVSYENDLVVKNIVKDIIHAKKSGIINPRHYLSPAKLVRRNTF